MSSQNSPDLKTSRNKCSSKRHSATLFHVPNRSPFNRSLGATSFSLGCTYFRRFMDALTLPKEWVYQKMCPMPSPKKIFSVLVDFLGGGIDFAFAPAATQAGRLKEASTCCTQAAEARYMGQSYNTSGGKLQGARRYLQKTWWPWKRRLLLFRSRG